MLSAPCLPMGGSLTIFCKFLNFDEGVGKNDDTLRYCDHCEPKSFVVSSEIYLAIPLFLPSGRLTFVFFRLAVSIMSPFALWESFLMNLR